MTRAPVGLPADSVGEGRGDGSRAVAIGGGHGLSRCLRSLTYIVDHVTAVVTTADDGGSSGRLRRQLGVLPPGDLRMALAALSPRGDLVRLLQYRFKSGELQGHSIGNLMIVAAADLDDGDAVAGLDFIASLLEIRGQVLPCTPVPVQLCGQAERREITGQVAIARSRGVERVWLEPQGPPGTPEAVDAIAAADLVALGPGSLFTSIIPNLLVPAIRAAVVASECPVVYICNVREQRGETEGLDLPAHLTALLDHAPGLALSAIVAHTGPRPPCEERPLRADREELAPFTSSVVLTDLLDGDGGHDPRKLAGALDHLLRRRSQAT
ncbi:MAG: uridine diphosphate-N-acetylglucosamine-binding protein YvcK [Nitriliruptorales bacterium]